MAFQHNSPFQFVFVNTKKCAEIKLMSVESLTFAVNRRQSLTKNNLASRKHILLELEIELLKKLVSEYQSVLKKKGEENSQRICIFDKETNPKRAFLKVQSTNLMDRMCFQTSYAQNHVD